MDAVEYRGKLLKDGHISCPKSAKEKLSLSSDDEVTVIIIKSPRSRSDAQGILARTKHKAAEFARTISTEEAWQMYDEAAGELYQEYRSKGRKR